MADVGTPAPRGLFDGFEGYRTVGRDEIASALAQGLVVPDANVLLNLYRYTADSRANLLSVLEKVSSQLWVPHQVLVEFWRNRESVMRDPGDSDKTIDALDALCSKAVNDLQAWANRVSMPSDAAKQLAEYIEQGFAKVAEEMQAHSMLATTEFSRDTSNDTVLKSMAPILQGRIGPEMDENTYKKAVAEGIRRVTAEEPPGYKDKKKEGDRAAGDYLVWEQILLEAERSKKSVVLVTGDTKEDWWRMEGGERRGPRVELVQEMYRRTGQRFLMLRPAQLLQYGQEFFEVSTSDKVVRDVEFIDSTVSDAEEIPPNGGWTVEGLVLLLVKLNSEGKVQADVIRVAARQAGYVSREQVYQIGGYSPERSLRGFTRPINRISQYVKGMDMAAPNAVDVLWTVYNDESPEIGWAAGFRIQSDVLPLLRRVPSEVLECDYLPSHISSIEVPVEQDGTS